MLELAKIFNNGVVLQREAEIRIFGTAVGEVIVNFAGQTRSVIADGDFIVRFPPQKAGGPYELTVECGDCKRIINDVMVGDVFVVAGQSNAELPICETDDADAFFPSRNDVRYFMLKGYDRDPDNKLIPLVTPFDDKWSALDTSLASKWSAVSLFVGTHFADKEKVAVGVIGAFRGATSIQGFMSEKSVAKFPYIIDKMYIDHRIYPWNKPSLLYNRLVKPLFPFAVKSVIWYQGESNVSEFESGFYSDMLMTLVNDFRDGFEYPQLPFVIVQINKFLSDKIPAGWDAIRLAQVSAAEKLKNVRLVIIDDLGQHERIHPTNKRAVSARICDALESF